ncbi:MAG TPA: hypothetical protein VK941_04055 [Gillisia sp.]|nr:hypothetical protein [Gillisia sp.]
MRRVVFLGMILSFFGLASCDVGDNDTPCITRPVELFLEFVEEETGENLYSNNTFEQADLEITDEDGGDVPFTFIRDLDRTFLQLSLGMEEGERVISIQPDAEVSLDIELTLARLQDSCGSYYISEFDVTNYDYDQDGFPGVVRILF